MGGRLLGASLSGPASGMWQQPLFNYVVKESQATKTLDLHLCTLNIIILVVGASVAWPLNQIFVMLPKDP